MQNPTCRKTRERSVYNMDIRFSSTVLASMLRIATPLTIASLGCLLCYKTGVLNLALEGIMLIGAFASVSVVIWTSTRSCAFAA